MTKQELYRRSRIAIECVNGDREWPDSSNEPLSLELDYLMLEAHETDNRELYEKLESSYIELTA